jgi:hypothetical protein
MPTTGNLHTSLHRLCTIPTFRFTFHTSLCLHHHARIERIPLVVSRTSSTASSSSKLVVSGKLEKFPISKSDFREIRLLPGMAYFDKTEYIPQLEKGQMFSSFAAPGVSESRSPSLRCDTSMDSSSATYTTSFSRCVLFV